MYMYPMIKSQVILYLFLGSIIYYAIFSLQLSFFFSSSKNHFFLPLPTDLFPQI